MHQTIKMNNNWTDIPDSDFSRWASLTDAVYRCDLQPLRVCPGCGATGSLRFFYMRHRLSGQQIYPSERGGFWIWCSACRLYAHTRCIVPDWWPDVPGVPYEHLVPEPELLNELWPSIASALAHRLPPDSTPRNDNP